MDAMQADVLVVGAGVVGLAVARALAQSGRDVLVCERHQTAGSETSSRNSGVIHSGIYYPGGSLKASLCIRGRELLYAYCAARGIPHDRCGKLIVAQPPELPALEALYRKGLANGVDDMVRVGPADIRTLEPEVRAAAAILIRCTGIIDVHEYLYALIADVEAAGGLIAYETTVTGAQIAGSEIRVSAVSGGSEAEVRCRLLVNAAGLGARRLLNLIRGCPQDAPAARIAKGNYFDYAGTAPFRHLVYPMPSEAGLGVHATLDLGGRMRFGPDVEWIDADGEPDYGVDPRRAEPFYEAIRAYWPGLPHDSLRPAYAGMRPKLVGPGEPAPDFRVQVYSGDAEAQVVNLLGIESPGLTASLAIAELVSKQVLR